MSRPKPHLGVLSETDAELLAQAYRQVIPIKGHARVTHEPLRQPIHQEQVARRRANAATTTATEAGLSDGDPFSLDDVPDAYRASGISNQAVRQLKRQAASVRETLDLHGLTRDQARLALQHFVGQATARGISKVRVIHGQGYGSRDGASVLRYLARHWLQQMPAVLAFVTPPATDGGKGAVLVLLRTPQVGHDRLR
jgi:DNA-nicking Smr family endonuclease